jgi:hypothetical protein
VGRLGCAAAFACLALLQGSPAGGQLHGSIGSSARRVAANGSGWQTSGELTSSLRLDHPLASTVVDAVIERRAGLVTLGGAFLGSTVASPAVGGLRLVADGSVERGGDAPSVGDRRSASAALSFRRGASGAWLGYGAERFSTPGALAGLWRKLGGHGSVSIGSTIRRAHYGGRAASIRTVMQPDSQFSDTLGGWVHFTRPRTFGDSGRAAARMTWAETEARVGWSVGPVAFDGVVGWRPRVDTVKQARWVRAHASLSLARNVALSIGAGTVTRRLPFVRSEGRFGSVALRLSPAALLRPKAPPQITSAAGAFSVSKTKSDEYVVSIRAPRARVVELSGDFNGWRPIRLELVRGDLWQATLAIPPGTYRMNLRVDGERWVAPPGTVTVDDEFNGRVGLVVVR